MLVEVWGAPWCRTRFTRAAGLTRDRAARKKVRWLYTSSDAGNRVAAAFYRKLGFVRVGRLPDLVRVGSTEILWRRTIL